MFRNGLTVCIGDKLGNKKARYLVCVYVCGAETKGGGGGCRSRRGDFEGTGGGGIGDGRCCPSMTSVNLLWGLLLGGRVCWPCLTSAANLAEVCIRLFVCGCIQARMREKGEGCWKRMFLFVSLCGVEEGRCYCMYEKHPWVLGCQI